jgi:hypothetical protein
MTHEFVGLGTGSRDRVGIEPGDDTNKDGAGGDSTSDDKEIPEMRADGQGEADMGDRVTNVVEVGTEPASYIKFGGENAIEIIHEIVENDQGDHVLVAILKKKNHERQDPE